MRKNVLLLGLSFVLLYSINVFGASITIDGKVLKTDVSPVIMNGYTMVPMRSISEALGATVDYQPESKGITITGNNKTIKTSVGSMTALVNNKDTILLGTRSAVIDGQTMIPVRAISDMLECTVNWDAASETVIITTSNSSALNTTSNQAGEVSITHTDGYVYTGFMLNGEFIGNVVVTKQDGEVEYEGVIKNYAPNGWGKLYTSDGYLEGNFENFLPQGICKGTFSDGYILADYKDGKVIDGSYPVYNFDDEFFATAKFKDDVIIEYKTIEESFPSTNYTTPKQTQTTSQQTQSQQTQNIQQSNANRQLFEQACQQAYTDYMMELKNYEQKMRARGQNATDSSRDALYYDYIAKINYYKILYGISE